MVLVEGDKADGAIVDHDTFDITASSDTATASAAEQIAGDSRDPGERPRAATT